ncbi:hypothetical protein ACFPOA_11765 [Lysobacter niabensis]|uniref:hypothetical protein n=1 Tax=Agrilutibacter niabensis TaxID=380628 RepID=UPI003612802B
MKALLLSVLLSAACWAACAADQPPSGDTSLLQLVEQQRALKAQIDAGSSGLTPRQVKQVRKAQDEFFAIADGKDTLAQLSVDEKIRVENALELINAEVVDTRVAGDDQNVCWRERASGTHMKVTRCGTKQEMREAREGARDYLDRPKTCGADCGANP